MTASDLSVSLLTEMLTELPPLDPGSPPEVLPGTRPKSVSKECFEVRNGMTCQTAKPFELFLFIIN